MRPLSLSLIWFSHAETPSPSLPPLSHLFALGDPVDGYRWILDPKVTLPLPLPPPPSTRRPWPAPLPTASLPGALAPSRVPPRRARPSHALPGSLGPRPRPSPVRSSSATPSPR